MNPPVDASFSSELDMYYSSFLAGNVHTYIFYLGFLLVSLFPLRSFYVLLDNFFFLNMNTQHSFRCGILIGSDLDLAQSKMRYLWQKKKIEVQAHYV